MQQKLIVLLLTLFLLSCKDDTNEDLEYTKAKTVKDATNHKLNLNNETPELVAFNFYKWYLKDIYLKKYVESPEIKLNKDSVYVLDTKKHKKFIEENSFFSKSFYDNEELTFRNCEKELVKVSWKEVEKSGAINPADFLDGRAVELARREAAGGPAHRAETHPGENRRDPALCHARPDRGDDHGDPCRRAERGPARAVRLAARGL